MAPRHFLFSEQAQTKHNFFMEYKAKQSLHESFQSLNARKILSF